MQIIRHQYYSAVLLQCDRPELLPLHLLQAQAVWLASTLAGPLLAGGGTFTSVAPRQGEIGGRQFGTAAVQTGATEPGQGAVQGGAARLKGPLKPPSLQLEI